MADIAYVESSFGTTDKETKKAAVEAFRYVLNNVSLLPNDKNKAANFQMKYLSGTTSSNANEEFSVAHGLENTPQVLIPVALLTDEASQIVPLTISKAADARRVYLKSSSTSAAFSVLVG